jgi:non-specific serine/threonine protein kinase
VDALQLTLTPNEKREMAERPIENAQLLEYYLRARHEANTFTKAGVERALGYYESGLDLIGDNALLRAGLAYTYYQSVSLGLGEEKEVDRAEENAKKALELDPDCAEAHLTLGLVYSCLRGDQRRACDHLKLSLAVRPDDAHTLSWLVIICYVVGKMDEAVQLMDKARQLDPLDPMVRWLPALIDFGVGRFYEAANFAWHGLPPLPIFDFSHASALAYTQRFDEARALIVERVDTKSDDYFTRASQLLEAAIDNAPDQITSLLSRDDTQRTFRRDPAWSYYAASFLALAGLHKTALDWLENAVDRGFINFPLLAEHDPFLSRLRGQTRYDTLMVRVKREWEEFEV